MKRLDPRLISRVERVINDARALGLFDHVYAPHTVEDERCVQGTSCNDCWTRLRQLFVDEFQKKEKEKDDGHS